MAFAIALGAASPPASGAPRLKLSTVSSRAEDVSGEDALVAVEVPRGIGPARVVVRRNGTAVTPAFSARPGESRRLIGLVRGLRRGGNTISAWAPGLSRASVLRVFDSPITGPIFSGPHQTPFYCRTVENGLGAPTDEDCSAPTAVEYRYRSQDGTFKPLPDPSSRPADLAQTTTSEGKTVDYVVRIESGVVNRSVYRWAILAPGGQLGKGWNHRMIYSFGGGCAAGHEQGDAPVSAVLDNRQLSRGYTVVSSSLNVLGTACNDVLSAETASMIKERLVESLGEAPRWTIGEGGSGGSVQIQMIAQNYPGILDGLMPAASFPDNSSPAYPDCRLLNSYFASPAGSGLSATQRSAITGLANPDGCLALGAGADVVNASEGCNESVVPPAVIFDPITNPGGIRCTLFDSLIAVYGRDPATGAARRPLDNVGVQYGLQALNEGKIDVDQFLDLNESIGGYDSNGFLQPQRTVADPGASSIASRTGRINAGAGGLPRVPIVDVRTYVDDEVNVHQYVNTYRFRARLQQANGTYGNQVMFRAKGGQNVSAMNDTALDTLASWLDRIVADHSGRSPAAKVLAERPADAVDACWTNGGQRTDGAALIGDQNLCETTYPPHSLPDMVAGKPLGALAGKCRLRPIDFGDYPPLSPAQEQRAEAVFPGGVCDYSKPGAGQMPLEGTWLSFGPKHTVPARRRALSLEVRARRVRRGGEAVLHARLRPCPETTWQLVRFQRLVKGRWRSAGAKIVNGPGCVAGIRVRIRRGARFRARSEALPGYAGAVSAPRRAGVRRRSPPARSRPGTR
ncbi:MAG: DUF6351 family protein [Solirubrobacterales bacterium]